MTIKIKAPVIWLEADIFEASPSVRVDVSEKRYRAVSESDWRKLMRLVRAVEACDKVPLDVCRAIVAMKEKKK